MWQRCTGLWSSERCKVWMVGLEAGMNGNRIYQMLAESCRNVKEEIHLKNAQA